MDFENKKRSENSIYSVGLGEKDRLVSSFTKHVVETNFKETRQREAAVADTRKKYDMIAQMHQEKHDDEEADLSETEAREAIHMSQLGKRSREYARNEEALLDEFEESQRKRGKADPLDRLFNIAAQQPAQPSQPVKPRLSVSAVITKSKNKKVNSLTSATTDDTNSTVASSKQNPDFIPVVHGPVVAPKQNPDIVEQIDDQSKVPGLLLGYDSETSSDESGDSADRLPAPTF
jgi:hypothetical protein